jgi:hypothetical protein
MYGRANSIFGRASPRPLQRPEIDYQASQRLEIDYQASGNITRVVGGNAIAFLRWNLVWWPLAGKVSGSK